MPDCSKRSSRTSGSSRNRRSSTRTCIQTGSRCTDRQNLCCLSSAEIEGRITQLHEKMRQYNEELRERVAEISNSDGPMDKVLMTVVEMTTKYERPIEDINFLVNEMASGLEAFNRVINGTASENGNGLVNGETTGTARGMANARNNGGAHRATNGPARGKVNGGANRLVNGTARGAANGSSNGTAHRVINGTPRAMVNGINGGANRATNRMMNGTKHGGANRVVNGTARGIVNGGTNRVVNGTARGVVNGVVNEEAIEEINETNDEMANGETMNGTSSGIANGAENGEPTGARNVIGSGIVNGVTIGEPIRASSGIVNGGAIGEPLSARTGVAGRIVNRSNTGTPDRAFNAIINLTINRAAASRIVNRMNRTVNGNTIEVIEGLINGIFEREMNGMGNDSADEGVSDDEMMIDDVANGAFNRPRTDNAASFGVDFGMGLVGGVANRPVHGMEMAGGAANRAGHGLGMAGGAFNRAPNRMVNGDNTRAFELPQEERNNAELQDETSQQLNDAVLSALLSSALTHFRGDLLYTAVR